MSADGFSSRISQQRFLKKTPFGKVSFHLGFLKRVYGFETIVDAAVRFDEVETIVNQYPINTLITEKERKDTFTIGTNFVVDGRPPIWEIEFEEEILIAANEILELLREEGRIFLEDNSTLKDIFKSLRQDPAKGRNALTVAYLLKDKDSFDQITREQRILLYGKPDNRYSKFLVLENELRNRFNRDNHLKK